MEQANYHLHVNNVSKSFPGVKVLDNVSFTLKKGEVRAFLGENGAGKSTLMKILMGMYTPDSGEILFEGKPIHFTNPKQALDNGISMIHQELNPIPDMSVADNVFLNRETRIPGTPFRDKRDVERRTQALLDQFKMNINPKSLVRSLTIAQTQMIEIIKAVSCNARLVIMDEPTSSLDGDETEKLFSIIKELKKRDVAVIYITHRLEEIYRVADSVTILCDGRITGNAGINDLTEDQIIARMVGRELAELYPKVDANIGEVVLEVKGLTKPGVFEDVNFQLRKGEMLGFAGLVGAGRSEIMRAVFGLDWFESGEIFIEGKKTIIKNAEAAINNGIAMLPEDRKDWGLIGCRSILENASLASLRRYRRAFLDKKMERDEVIACVKSLTLKYTDINNNVFSLSGGNQQKVVLGKWLLTNPRILIVDEPTRGVDVGAKAEIHKILSTLASKGMAIIIISSDMPEIIGMCDRILVVSSGRITREVHRDEIIRKEVTQENILESALKEVAV
ncbi:MAG: sugar ABC transporter ATP-binding protein [Planctomycetaceae bacterium]|nr:sugar ABC transporter ATP-binding protein [Planctomycetaceae bacterium]